MLMFAGIQSHAQETKKVKKLVSGNSVNMAFPVGDMESWYNNGWGFYANIDYNFNSFLAGRFDLGWNSFNSTDITDPVIGLPVDEKLNVWEFTGGLRAKISVFYAEAKGGYFTGIKEWGFVPAVGLRFGKLDLQGYVTVAGDYQWGGVRIGYYWGN